MGLYLVLRRTRGPALGSGYGVLGLPESAHDVQCGL